MLWIIFFIPIMIFIWFFNIGEKKRHKDHKEFYDKIYR
jgi:preprotein translocase subunit YajC